ncbi:MAG: hypothetical protein R3B58_08955 [Phycisphaerales bacterium]
MKRIINMDSFCFTAVDNKNNIEKWSIGLRKQAFGSCAATSVACSARDDNIAPVFHGECNIQEQDALLQSKEQSTYMFHLAALFSCGY